MAGTNYKTDRAFTDSVHKKIIVPTIYSSFGWKEIPKSPELADIKDSLFGIDYEILDRMDKKILLQERFRRSKYHDFNDFTLRYERNENPDETEQKSEFYKIKSKIKRLNEPFYLLYGLLNNNDTICDKYVIVDLRILFNYIEQKKIIPDESITNCVYKNNVLYIPIKYNSEINSLTGETYSSSSMICFNVIALSRIFPDSIVYQKGFYNEPISIKTISRLALIKGYQFKIDPNITYEEMNCLMTFLNIDGYVSNLIYQYISSNTSKIVGKYLQTIKRKG